MATALEAAETDDLVLIFGDEIARSWRQINDFKPGSVPSREAKKTVPPVTAPSAPSIDLGESAWVHDERGVHLAREIETGDD